MGTSSWIEDRGDRGTRWRARYRGPDGRVRSRSFGRKVDAQQWLRDELGKMDRGLWVDPDAGAVTYEEWAKAWLASKHDLSDRTRFDYEELLRTRLLPTFGPIEVRRIAPLSVREWVGEMVGDGLSAARVTKARHVLRSSLEMAVADGLIWRNPTAHVGVPASRSREQRFLTAAEVGVLAAAIDRPRQADNGKRSAQPRDGGGLLIRWLSYTGMRWGEVAALRVAALDTSRRRVRVSEAVSEIGGKLVVGPTKTHEARTITMPTFLAKRVEAHIEQLHIDDLLFASPAGGFLRNSNWRARVWRQALKDTGIDPGLRIHDLRHTAASLMIASGASIKAVQRQLGHATASMTLDVYGHLYDDDLDGLADALDGRFAVVDAIEEG